MQLMTPRSSKFQGIENEFIGNKNRMQHICRLLAVAFSIDDRGKINSLSDEYNVCIQ